ncbi:hypothetical protein JCM11641_004631 [Rhodosporidiobolus odoratus]
METPYPPPTLQSASPSASSSSSSNPSNSSLPHSVDPAPSSSEPRRSLKRHLPADDQQDGTPSTPEEEDGVEVDEKASRPRGLGGARSASKRKGTGRRASLRANGAEWTTRSASEGRGETVVNGGGPSEGARSEAKRRRVDTLVTEPMKGLLTVPAPKGHPRPARLSFVPSYQDDLRASSQPLPSLSPAIIVSSASSASLPPMASTSQPPCASPLLPPPTAATAATSLPFPLTPATPPADQPSTNPVFAPRPRPRRRANSLPTSSSRNFFAPYLFPQPSPSYRLAPFPSVAAPMQLLRRHKFYDLRARLRRPAVAPVPADPFLLRTGGVASALDPRLVGARLDYARAGCSISPSELLAIHAVRLAGVEGGSAVPLNPTGLIPPISKATLRELDMQEIMRNPQLRHDIVFDPNLMFRPNYDGERGERKRVAAEQYWTALDRELTFGCRCATFRNNVLLPCVCLPISSSPRPTPPPFSLSARLPTRIIPLIVELGNVLLSLLPAPSGEHSPPLASSPTFASALSPYPSTPVTATSLNAARDHILEVLEPSALAYQLAHGVLNVSALAAFLGRTLKTHCAPMRDSLVDQMVMTCEGEGIARGLRQCFKILELMKLDIANHQLRSLRPYLVESSVAFERRFLQEHVTRRGGQASLERLRDWLAPASEKKPRTGDRVEQAVVDGLLNLVFSPHASASTPSSVPLPALSSLPDTVQLDSYRLQAFHADAADLTVLYQLLLLFQQLSYPARPSPADVDSLRKELWCIMSSATGSASTLAGPASNIVGIPQGPPGQGVGKLSSESWRSSMEDILLQVAARAKEQQLRHVSPSASTLSAAPAASLPPTPDAKTLALVSSYFDSNVKPDSKLFQLLQSRLRETLRAVVEEELVREKEKGPSGYTSWWAPSVESSTMATGAAHPARSAAVSAEGFRPEQGMMASSVPAKRGVKRSVGLDDDDAATSDEESEKRQRTGRSSSISTKTGLPIAVTVSSPPSAVDIALSRSGLAPLASEVRILGQRIAKVASYNLSVYRSFYEALLTTPSTPPSSAVSSPTV